MTAADRLDDLQDRHTACDCGVRCWTADTPPRTCQCSCGGEYHGGWGDYKEAAQRVDRVRSVPSVPSTPDGLQDLLAFRRDVEVVLFATDSEDDFAAARGNLWPGSTSTMRTVRPRCERLLADVDREIARVETDLAEQADAADMVDDDLDAYLGVDDAGYSDAERDLAREEFRDAAADIGQLQRVRRDGQRDRKANRQRGAAAAAHRPSSAPAVASRARQVDQQRAEQVVAREEKRLQRVRQRANSSAVSIANASDGDKQSTNAHGTRAQLRRLAVERKADHDARWAKARAAKAKDGGAPASLKIPALRTTRSQSRETADGYGAEHFQARGAGDPTTMQHSWRRPSLHTRTGKRTQARRGRVVARQERRVEKARARRDTTVQQASSAAAPVWDGEDSVSDLAYITAVYAASVVARGARWAAWQARRGWWTLTDAAAGWWHRRRDLVWVDDTVIDLPQQPRAITAESESSAATVLFHQQIGLTPDREVER